MPELPEVETTRRGLLSAVLGNKIIDVTVRDRRLRWPIPANLAKHLAKRVVAGVSRRGKYLLWDIESASGGGFLLCHLGMSGSLFVAHPTIAVAKHDHVDIIFDDKIIVRYHDPRRFGAMLWIPGPNPSHPLLDKLGPEPLDELFNGRHLFDVSRGRSIGVKEFIMNANVVVGVGNIYASEALFIAGIRPTTAAGRISHKRYDELAAAIRQILNRAIAAGGSSLRNYVKADGQKGHFQLETHVYDRAGEPCARCNGIIHAIRQGQRSTYYCPQCQR